MISFIVPAYNEECLIGSVLDSIHQAAAALGPGYEVIVVDDASTDRTAEIAAEKGAQVVSVHHRQIAATRNSGARSASGDLLVFVDIVLRVALLGPRSLSRRDRLEIWYGDRRDDHGENLAEPGHSMTE